MGSAFHMSVSPCRASAAQGPRYGLRGSV